MIYAKLHVHIIYMQQVVSISLTPRLRPAFRRLQYTKKWGEPSVLAHVNMM